ncbi:MAG: hypothetical protein RLZZ387_4871 [Chloroflexota bacterium]
MPETAGIRYEGVVAPTTPPTRAPGVEEQAHEAVVTGAQEAVMVEGALPRGGAPLEGSVGATLVIAGLAAAGYDQLRRRRGV